jgi:hypothetical protein
MARVPGSAMRRAVDVRQWKAKERKLPLLCLSCNNHWLSDIESRTSPILAPLIRGEPAALTERDQARLALWAVKTTVLLQFTMAPDQQGVPQAHFDYLYQRRAIPPHVWVWIASYDGEPYNTIFGWQRLSPEVALDAGTTVAAADASTIGVHKVVLEVTGGLFPARSKPYEIGLKDPSADAHTATVAGDPRPPQLPHRSAQYRGHRPVGSDRSARPEPRDCVSPACRAFSS